MAQREAGLFRVLGASRVYRAFQSAVGAEPFRRRLATWIDAAPGHRVLDIGCGPAEILAHLPAGIEYHGFDDSAAYLATARARHDDRGHFWQARVESASLARLGRFDRVIAIGVLHHLDDEAAATLVRLAAAALAPGGRFLTYDPCWAAGQGWVARALIARDRGRDVRDAHGYARLARASFRDVRPEVIRGHLRIPYTATVLRCAEPVAPAP
jgi:SAM-dependent methyltransferase